MATGRKKIREKADARRAPGRHLYQRGEK